MADSFEITAAIPSQRLDAGLRIVETMQASGFTKPNGVNFTVEVDKVPGWKDALLAAAAAEAAELESLFAA